MQYQISYWQLDGAEIYHPVIGQIDDEPVTEDELKTSAIGLAQKKAREYGESTMATYTDDGDLVQLTTYEMVSGHLHSDTLRV